MLIKLATLYKSLKKTRHIDGLITADVAAELATCPPPTSAQKERRAAASSFRSAPICLCPDPCRFPLRLTPTKTQGAHAERTATATAPASFPPLPPHAAHARATPMESLLAALPAGGGGAVAAAAAAVGGLAAAAALAAKAGVVGTGRTNAPPGDDPPTQSRLNASCFPPCCMYARLHVAEHAILGFYATIFLRFL